MEENSLTIKSLNNDAVATRIVAQMEPSYRWKITSVSGDVLTGYVSHQYEGVFEIHATHRMDGYLVKTIRYWEVAKIEYANKFYGGIVYEIEYCS